MWQFPTAAASMNHLRKANNNFSDGLTNLKWVIFLRKNACLMPVSDPEPDVFGLGVSGVGLCY